MTHRRFAAAAAATSLVLAACGGGSPAGGSGAAAGDCSRGGDVVIGVIAPRSGAVASIVGSFTGGAEQAAKDVNARGGVCGRHLRVVGKDNTGDSTKDQSLAQQLVEQDHASGVISVSDDDYANFGQYLQQQHVLDVGAYVSDALDDPTNAVDTFSVAVPNRVESRAWTGYLLGQAHIRRPAVLYETVSAYGRLQSRTFCDAAQAAGTPCVDEETTTLDTTDVSAQVGKMKGRGADGILLEGFGIPVVKTIATARAAGITGPILGTQTTATSVSLVAGFLPAAARQGFVYVNFASATRGTASAATGLAAELRQTAPITEPLFVPMFAYDAVQLMALGWNNARSLNADDASVAIEKVNEKAGQGHFFLHDYAFSDKHHISQFDPSALTLCVAEPLDSDGLAKPLAG